MIPILISGELTEVTDVRPYGINKSIFWGGGNGDYLKSFPSDSNLQARLRSWAYINWLLLGNDRNEQVNQVS